MYCANIQGDHIAAGKNGVHKVLNFELQGVVVTCFSAVPNFASKPSQISFPL